MNKLIGVAIMKGQYKKTILINETMDKLRYGCSNVHEDIYFKEEQLVTNTINEQIKQEIFNVGADE